MKPAHVIVAGAVAGIAVASLRLGEGPLSFQLGLLLGGALGGMLLAWLVARAARWTG